MELYFYPPTGQYVFHDEPWVDIDGIQHLTGWATGIDASAIAALGLQKVYDANTPESDQAAFIITFELNGPVRTWTSTPRPVDPDVEKKKAKAEYDALQVDLSDALEELYDVLLTSKALKETDITKSLKEKIAKKKELRAKL